jgi:hypothetical protein
MANVFDGPWRSTLINDRLGPRGDSVFNLEVDPATNRLRPTTHSGQPVTGDVTNVTIRMNQTFPSATVTYQGELCGEVMVGGTLRLLVRGVFTLNTIGPLDEETSIQLAKEFPGIKDMLETNNLAQLQEVWVAAKP